MASVRDPREHAEQPVFLPLFVTVLVIADIVSTMESSMIYVAFKAIIAETGSPITAGWLLSIYFMVAGPAAVICGRLGDMYGRKRVLIWTLTIMCLGCLLSAASRDMTLLIVGRGLQGVAGGVIPLCVGLMRGHVPAKKLGVPLGFLLGASALGVMFGMVTGGLIIDHWSWRHLFIFLAGGAAFALAGVAFFVPRSPRGARQRLDWVGAALYAPAMAGLLYGISAFNSPILSPTQACAIVAACVVLLALWVVYELRQESPLVDLRSFTNRTTATICITTALVYLGSVQIPQIFGLVAQQPLWTGIGFGLSATVAGLYKIPGNLIAAAVGPVAGYAGSRWSGRGVILIGTAIAGLSWVSMALDHRHFWVFVGAALFASVGSGTQSVGLTNMMAMSAPPAKTSEVVGALYVVKGFAQAVGAQLLALVLSLSVVSRPGPHPMTFPDERAHTLTFILVAMTCLLTVFTTMALRREAAPAEELVPEVV